MALACFRSLMAAMPSPWTNEVVFFMVGSRVKEHTIDPKTGLIMPHPQAGSDNEFSRVLNDRTAWAFRVIAGAILDIDEVPAEGPLDIKRLTFIADSCFSRNPEHV